MRVEGDAGATLAFSAYEQGERALAWIVEERELRAALLPLVRRAGVDVIGGAASDALAWLPDAATLTLADGRALAGAARRRRRRWLVVGAQGAAGIVAVPRDYGQTAVVANFACERPHHGRAFQWFRPDGGVLAWLPLPGAAHFDRVVGAGRAGRGTPRPAPVPSSPRAWPRPATCARRVP